MRSDKKLRVVLDTNVWLSGLIFGGQPGHLLKLVADDLVLMVTSEELLSELRRTIIHKFPLYRPQLDLLSASVRQDGELVSLGSQTVTVCRDPDDDKVIETALIGNCDYIVSGDRDLLAIGEYQGIKIVKPAELLRLIKSF